MSAADRVLVTGGLGFQGLHLVRRLALQGREVTILNTPSARARRMAAEALDMGLPSACRVRLVYGSVNDLEVLEKTLPEHDAVIHMAAWASVDVSLDRPWPPFEINAQGTYALLDGIRRFIPEARVLVASSCEVYGPAQRVHDGIEVCVHCGSGLSQHPRHDGELIPQDESTPMLPRSPYAATKIAADRFAYAFAVTYGLRLSILRPCNIFGPYQRHGAAGAVIPTFTRAALFGYPFVITGGGQQVREFLYVDDLVEAYGRLLDTDAEAPGETFNVGSGETRTIGDVARTIHTRTRATSEILYGGQRVADVSAFRLDSNKFMARCDWKPRFTFDAALDEYLAWACDPEQGRPWLQ